MSVANEWRRYCYIVSTIELSGLVVKLQCQEQRKDICVVYIINVPTEKENKSSINVVSAKSIKKTIAVNYVTNVFIEEEIERVFTLHYSQRQSIEKTGIIIYMIDVPTVEDSGLVLILSVARA